MIKVSLPGEPIAKIRPYRRHPKVEISDQDLINAYIEIGNIWKVGEKFGIRGQVVHQRLIKLNVRLKNPPISEKEKQLIRDFYQKGFKSGSGELKKFSESLGRTVSLISKCARSMGLSDIKRKSSQESLLKMSKRSKKWHQENEHPRGMLGKSHTPEYSKECGVRAKKIWNELSEDDKKIKIMKSLKTRLKNHGTLAPPRGDSTVSWKQGWRIIGGKEKYFRSRWEANYARYLEFLKSNNIIKEWLHEPQTFWFEEIKRGCVSYLPDFKIINLDESHYWVEVKGYYDDRSKTKIKRFKKYFPDEKLEVVDSKWFKENAKKISKIIKDWEYSEKIGW